MFLKVSLRYLAGASAGLLCRNGDHNYFFACDLDGEVGCLATFGSPFSVFRINGMIDKNDLLLALRAVLTLVIGLFTLAMIGLVTTPFLGSADTYHKMATDAGAAGFIALRIVLTVIILTFSSFLLYLLGVICRRKINSHTYVAIAVLAVVLCAWRCYDFLDSYLWNYVPME